MTVFGNEPESTFITLGLMLILVLIIVLSLLPAQADLEDEHAVREHAILGLVSQHKILEGEILYLQRDLYNRGIIYDKRAEQEALLRAIKEELEHLPPDRRPQYAVDYLQRRGESITSATKQDPNLTAR